MTVRDRNSTTWSDVWSGNSTKTRQRKTRGRSAMRFDVCTMIPSGLLLSLCVLILVVMQPHFSNNQHASIAVVGFNFHPLMTQTHHTCSLSARSVRCHFLNRGTSFLSLDHSPQSITALVGPRRAKRTEHNNDDSSDEQSAEETMSKITKTGTTTSKTRRKTLQQVAMGTTGGILTWVGGFDKQNAFAYPPGYGGGGGGGREFRGDVDEENGIIDSTRRKVALRTSTENVPNKYEPDSKSKKKQTDQDKSNGDTVNEVGSSSDKTSTMCQCNTEQAVPTGPFQTSEQRRISTFERVAPSVVFIDTFSVARDSFSTNIMEVPLGAGSGFVWDDRGHIVTNFHVIRNARTAQVAVLTRVFPDDEQNKASGDGGVFDLSSRPTQSRSQSPLLRNKAIANMRNNNLSSSSTKASSKQKPEEGVTDYVRSVYKARTVGIDPDKDIAVLKIDAPVFDLIPIKVGESSKLKTGQETLAIGNPYGLDHTLTVGVISGTGREVRSPSGRPISNVIQTDAAINPGNSGGPLLNSNGELIGMNTAIYSPSGGSAGIGFAIPADTLKYIVETLIRDGRVVRPVLGISYLESKQAKALGISKGVLILDVPANSPAYRAGLRGTRRTESGLIELGDIIKQIDGRPIDTETDLFEVLEDYKPGDRVKITVSRVDVESTMNRSGTSSDPSDLSIGRQQSRIKMRDVTVTTELKGSQDAAAINRIFIE